MSFHQLATSIPLVENIATYTGTQKCVHAENHAILIVTHGHVKITTSRQAPFICTEGFALHVDDYPIQIDMPKTKLSEYVIISYKMLHAEQGWSLKGPLFSTSVGKILQLVEELIRIRALHHANQVEALTAMKERLLLERILFIYMVETAMNNEKKSTLDLVKETISYMNQHYMVDITLPMLAQRARLSVGHYTVLFKKLTGTTVNTYLIKLRIEKAKLLLVQTDLTAKEIASMVGCADYFHFSRSFKKIVGCAPSIYREQEESLQI